MGLGPGFEPHYEVLANKKDVVKKLKRGRQGRRHDLPGPRPRPRGRGDRLAHRRGPRPRPVESVQRVTFNEITKRRGAQGARSSRARSTYRKVDAQQARRVLDRLMGFRSRRCSGRRSSRASPPAASSRWRSRWSASGRPRSTPSSPRSTGCSAPTWPPTSRRSSAPAWRRSTAEKAEVDNGEQAAAIVGDLERGPFVVRRSSARSRNSARGPPFITSRLQQEAARSFGFSVKRTMGLAQGLYEGREIGDRGAIGLITYMRTDSTRVAEEALDEVREMIAATYGAKRAAGEAEPLPLEEGRAGRPRGDPPDHLRPAAGRRSPPTSSADELKLYKLIWDRFLASQMLPAVFDVTQADVERRPLRPARLRQGDEEPRLPRRLPRERRTPMTPRRRRQRRRSGRCRRSPRGRRWSWLKLASEQKFTQPPRAVQRGDAGQGAGRERHRPPLDLRRDPRHPHRPQLRREARGALPPDRPRPSSSTRMLQRNFHDIINEGYTASLEAELDRIEDGELGWKQALDEFDEKFTRDLVAAGETMPNVKRDGVPTDEICPDCGSPLVMRFGRYGAFIGCTNYPTCNYTRERRNRQRRRGAPAGRRPPKRRSRRARCAASRWPCAAAASAPSTAAPATRSARTCARPARRAPSPKPPASPARVRQRGAGRRSARAAARSSTRAAATPTASSRCGTSPSPSPARSCGAAFLMEKTTKKDGTQLVCNDKECGYSEPAPAAPAADDGASAN